jgi:hypothetical protein
MGWRLVCRQAAAMLVCPANRWRLSAKLRRVAMTAGPFPVRIWEWSSVKVTSRIQWTLFSIDQWSRMISASWRARMSSNPRSVTA